MKEWDNYQKGIDYNRRLPTDHYDLCDTCSDFKNGDQWVGADLDDDFLQPVFNIIAKACTFFIAYIASRKPSLRYQSPILKSDEDISDDVMNATWDEFTERVKFDKQYRQALDDGTVTGDYIALLMLEDTKPYGGSFKVGEDGVTVEGEIGMTLIDSTNFYVADPTASNDFWTFQKQKYVQYDGRSFTSELMEEREGYTTTIVSDEERETQIGEYGDIEMEPILSDDGKPEGMATWVTTLYKKRDEDGVDWVYSSKCTQNGYIWEDRPLGFNLYPVVIGNWLTQKNCYHGYSFVKTMIPTQIFINQLFAMAMKHTSDVAFSKFVYDVDSLEGITSEVSTQLGVKLKPGQSIKDVGAFMQPGNMSDKVIAMIDLAYNYIKDVIGLSDAITGNVNPEQASGVSIVASAKQAGIPIEVPAMNSFDWVEDIGRVFKNMIENLYGERPILMEIEGETVVGSFDYSTLKDMYKPPRIDVGQSSYYSEDTLVQTLDNLFSQGIMDVIDYLEEMPSGRIPGRDKLVAKLKKKQQEIVPQIEGQLPIDEQLQQFA